MNEQNPAVTESSQSAGAPSVPNSTPATTVNLRRARARGDYAIRPINVPAPQRKVTDSTLEEDDLRISIRVGVITRIEKLAGFKVEKTLYGMARSKSLFKDLDSLLQEIYESTALKVNRKLQPKLEEEDSALPPKSNGQEVPSKQAIPRSPRDEEFDQMFAHLDRRSRQSVSKVEPGLSVSRSAHHMTQSPGNPVVDEHSNG